ncbi:hypothetical protein ANO11243_076230 [Dothideomycetidae sp. 11243]|nr:hypothetical protein ANO11243_076230 [fungal sp. No.11243]
MLFFNLLFAAGVHLDLTLALPRHARRDIATTVDQLLAIAPAASSCNPATAQFANECATAEQAIGPISQSFDQYKIVTTNERAALLSLMAFETGEFKFDVHHFPGPNPGQGTRNMQNPQFNIEYADSIASLNGKVDPADPAGVLALLTADPILDFGSAVWFLRNKCTQAQQDALANGGQAEWEAFITDCVGTTLEGRQATYSIAFKVLSSGGGAASSAVSSILSAPSTSSTTPFPSFTFSPTPASPTTPPSSLSPPALTSSTTFMTSLMTTPPPVPTVPASTPEPLISTPAAPSTPSPTTSLAASPSALRTSPSAPASVLSGVCTFEGDWNCIDGRTWQRCAAGMWTAVMPVADGTMCAVGQGDDLTVYSAPA